MKPNHLTGWSLVGFLVCCVVTVIAVQQAFVPGAARTGCLLVACLPAAGALFFLFKKSKAGQ